jgi:ABC-type iron transport system FetAB ATPase subunit
MSALLRIEDLRTVFRTPMGEVAAVDGVSLEVARGRTLGIVGESGCGKSVLSLSVMRLVPTPGRNAGWRVLFEGRDLLALPEDAMRDIRGNRIAMIFQEPMTSLNPAFTVGDQITEARRAHDRTASDRALRAKAIAAYADMAMARTLETNSVQVGRARGGYGQKYQTVGLKSYYPHEDFAFRSENAWKDAFGTIFGSDGLAEATAEVRRRIKERIGKAESFHDAFMAATLAVDFPMHWQETGSGRAYPAKSWPADILDALEARAGELGVADKPLREAVPTRTGYKVTDAVHPMVLNVARPGAAVRMAPADSTVRAWLDGVRGRTEGEGAA